MLLAKHIIAAVLILAAAAAGVAGEEGAGMRTWTSSAGGQVQAKYLRSKPKGKRFMPRKPSVFDEDCPAPSLMEPRLDAVIFTGKLDEECDSDLYQHAALFRIQFRELLRGRGGVDLYHPDQRKE